MHDALTVYFNGEKYAGLLLAGAALGVVAVAAIMYRARADLRPFAVTLAALALVQIALGLGLYLKTGPQVRGLAERLAADEPAFRAAERARMARVQRTFVIVEYVEVAVIVVAALVAFAQKGRPAASGVALGLLIGASFLLAFDLIAERRGAEYLAALESGAAARPD